MFLEKDSRLPKKTVILTVIALICFVLFFVGGPDYYSPRSNKYLWGLGHILNDLKGALKKRILKVEGMHSYCKEQFDRINKIIRIKGPSAKGRFAAGDKKSNRSCKSCLPNLSNEIFVAFISSGWNLFIPFHRGLTKIHKIESIQLP
jgi:hypothetical protein